MDTRALILGSLAVVATICSTILFALGVDGGELLGGLAATSAAYVVGLYSEPQTRGALDG